MDGRIRADHREGLEFLDLHVQLVIVTREKQADVTFTGFKRLAMLQRPSHQAQRTQRNPLHFWWLALWGQRQDRLEGFGFKLEHAAWLDATTAAVAKDDVYSI